MKKTITFCNTARLCATMAVALCVLLSGCAQHTAPSPIVPTVTEVPPVVEVATTPPPKPSPVETPEDVEDAPTIDTIVETIEDGFTVDPQYPATSWSHARPDRTQVVQRPEGIYFIDMSRSYNMGPTTIYKDDGEISVIYAAQSIMKSLQTWGENLYFLEGDSLYFVPVSSGERELVQENVSHYTVGDGWLFIIQDGLLCRVPIHDTKTVTPIWYSTSEVGLDGYYGQDSVGLDGFYAIGSDVLLVFGIGEYADRQSFMYLSYADGSFERLPETLIPDYYDGTNFFAKKKPEGSDDFYLYKQDINARTSTQLFQLPAPFDNWFHILDNQAYAHEQTVDGGPDLLYILDFETGNSQLLTTYDSWGNINILDDTVGFTPYMSQDYLYLTGKGHSHGIFLLTRMDLVGGGEEVFYHGRWMCRADFLVAFEGYG